MPRRIDIKKYLKKTKYTKAQWRNLKREYYRLEEEENLIKHYRSCIVVKLQCYTPQNQRVRK